MVQIQLFVDGQEVELYKDESVTLTQSIQDILNIEKVFTDYSRTFNVPASKTNNKIFKHFYNYYVDGFDARNRVDAELHLNYKPFKKGKIKLEGAQLKNNEAQTYKLTFFGQTITLKEKFGEDQLGSLTQLDNFSFAYNDTNIETYMTDGLDTNIGSHQIEDGIVFPLITHTDRLIYDSGDNTADTNNVQYDVLSTVARGVKFSQLKPAIRLFAIIKAIEYEYDIQFSDDFFSTTNLPFYGLYMWLHTKEGGIFTDNDAQYLVKEFGAVSGDTSDIKGVHNSYFKNKFNDDKNLRKMKVKTDCSVSDEYNLIVKKDGEEFKRFDGLSNVNTTEKFEIPEGSYSFFIESSAVSTYDVQISVFNEPSSFLRSDKEITFDGTTSILTDEQITITSHMPEMKVIDFITGIWKMFNLTSYINDQGTIVVQPLDDFYSSSTKVWDITEHVDKTENIVDSVIPFNDIKMGYEGTDTFLAKNHLDLANKPWGELSYKLTSDEGDVYEFQLPFEHMKFERLKDVSENDTPNVMYGWSVDSKQQPTIGKPLLFYVTKTITFVAAVNLSGSRRNITSPYTPSNSQNIGRSYGVDLAAQSLNFASEYDEYDSHPNEKTLFKTYYETYIKDIFDPKKRLTFLSAYLPIGTMEQMTLADKIVVFDKIYRINKMTTNFETNKTDFELTNIIDERQYVNSIASLEIDLSTEDITADITYLTVDIGNVTADGFTFPIESQEVPEDVEGNEITNTTAEPCEVTAATIYTNASTADADSIEFESTILTRGTICGQENIDEYGFLIASNSSYLTASDDIDTLKADSNITVVNVVRSFETNAPSLTVGTKTTTVESLTHPATRHARFYVRTNIQDIYDKADAISAVMTDATDSNQTASNEFLILSAGMGDVTGYTSTPTLAQIDAKQSTTQAAGRCGETLLHAIAYHNGTGNVPIVGDSIKFIESGDYTGGATSFPTIDGNPNDYGALSFGETANGTLVYGNRYNLTVTKYLVFQVSTSEVVAVYNCPPPAVALTGAFVYTHTNSYVFGESNGSFYGDSFVESFTPVVCGTDYSDSANVYLGEKVPNYVISHNGSGLNPVPGDFIKIDKKDGLATTSSFGDFMYQLPPTVSERVVFFLTDENLVARYLIGVAKSTGEVQAFAACT